MQKLVYFLYLSLICLGTHAQALAQVLNDFAVSLHEEAINKVFVAVGDIKGSNDYEVMLIKGKYHWTVKNPRINLKPDSSDFTCDAIVDVGPFNYKTQVVGNVKIAYDNSKNQISLQISRAIFELYTMLFGKKIHIKDIHLEEYFKDPFLFEGPKTLATDMEFTMPDSTTKKIFIQPTDCAMKVKLKEICTACEVVASDKPFKPIVKVVPPIQATKPADTKSVQPQKK